MHKPAEFSPLSARILIEIAEEAGLPPGVWTLVNGSGEDTGKALTEHKAIKAVAFVGESRTGSMITKQGADTLKRQHLELGGKNPVIAFDDADLVARVNNIKVAHPLDPATEIGPLIAEEHFNKVTRYFDIAKEGGATVAAGGVRVGDDGFFVRPTRFTDATNGMHIAQEEIFGPVLTLIPFTAEDEALAMANDTDYGLTRYLWTRDLTRALRITDRLEAGMI